MILTLGLGLCTQAVQAGWTPTKRLTWTSGYSGYPSIAVDPSSDLHVVWHDSTSGSHEIYHKKSTDGGVTWTASQRLTWNSDESNFPALAVDSSGHLHVIWSDFGPGASEIYYKKGTNEGASWTPTKRLTWTSGFSGFPSVAVASSGHLHVVWPDSTHVNYEIYYKRSTDEGATWTPSTRLTWTPSSSGVPAIAAGPAANIQVIWAETLPGNNEIYYKKSANGGVTWATTQRLTWVLGSSYSPAAALDSSGFLHLVWADDAPGNKEIYYKKGN
jgi:hypothetical protein